MLSQFQRGASLIRCSKTQVISLCAVRHDCTNLARNENKLTIGTHQGLRVALIRPTCPKVVHGNTQKKHIYNDTPRETLTSPSSIYILCYQRPYRSWLRDCREHSLNLGSLPCKKCLVIIMTSSIWFTKDKWTPKNNAPISVVEKQLRLREIVNGKEMQSKLQAKAFCIYFFLKSYLGKDWALVTKCLTLNDSTETHF